MAKSPTPLVIGLHPSVTLSQEFREYLEEKGHTLIVFGPDTTMEDILKCDIILGPNCYNYDGPLDQKIFDLLSKSARQLVRERKRKEKHGNRQPAG